MKSDSEMKTSGPPKTLDNTIRTTFDSCRRMSYWFFRGLEHRVTPPYFIWGRAWQEAMESWYAASDLAIPLRFEKAVKAAEDLWDTEGGQDMGTNKRVLLERLLKAYVVTYTDMERWRPIKLGEKIELGFEYPFGSKGYFLAGAVDGYLEWEPYGNLVLENKSSGVPLSDRWCGQWGFSTQVSQYSWGLTQIMGKEPFGVLINGVYKGTSLK